MAVGKKRLTVASKNCIIYSFKGKIVTGIGKNYFYQYSLIFIDYLNLRIKIPTILLFIFYFPQKALFPAYRWFRICRDRNILKEYLLDTKKVEIIMVSLSDEKQIMKLFIKNERYEVVRESTRKTAKRMIKKVKCHLMNERNSKQRLSNWNN